jgi:hypothetical protein
MSGRHGGAGAGAGGAGMHPSGGGGGWGGGGTHHPSGGGGGWNGGGIYHPGGGGGWNGGGRWNWGWGPRSYYYVPSVNYANLNPYYYGFGAPLQACVPGAGMCPAGFSCLGVPSTGYNSCQYTGVTYYN